MTNPFTVSQPVSPEKFVGRRRLIRSAFHQIKKRANLAVWGGIGMGKTSFLKYLSYPQIWQENQCDPSQAVIALVDCSLIYPLNSNLFWQDVLKKVNKKLNSGSRLQIEVEKLLQKDTNTKQDLLTVLDLLAREKKFLVLLVDNYDYALHSNEQYTEQDITNFVYNCRAATHHTCDEERCLSMIVTSVKQLYEIGPPVTYGKSPWENHYMYRHLKPFTDNEVNLLLQEKSTMFAWPDRIREIADGNPVLLQNACFLLYESLELGEIPHQETFIEELEKATRRLFDQIWNFSTEIEQTLLMLLALSHLKGRIGEQSYDLGGIEIIFSRNTEDIKNLVELGVLSKTSEEEEEGTGYVFTSSMMEWWVVDKIKKSDIREIRKREKVFRQLISTEQKDKAIVAIDWITKHQNQIPTILKWFGNFLQ